MLLEVQELKTYFSGTKRSIFKRSNLIKAVDGVSITLHDGETLGLVGESGSGKSTLGKAIVNLVTKTGGNIIFLNLESRSKLFRKEVQMIFQDPQASLNPRMRVGNAIAEVLKYHRIVPPDQVAERIRTLFEMVELSPELMSRYPHQFSGGQRQRLGIARALAAEPLLIICDEVVSALDVSVQAQIINLLKKLQKEKRIAYLFISHDLAVVRQIAHRIAVMYCGRIVEIDRCEEIISSPLHPYTKLLFSVASEYQSEINVRGEIANPSYPPSGCHFHPRCPIVNKNHIPLKVCTTQDPVLEEKSPGHFVACHQV